MPLKQIIINAFETVLILGGLVVLWRTFAKPAARSPAETSPLTRWEVSTSNFLGALWLMFVGFLLPAYAAGLIALRVLEVENDTAVIFIGPAAQIGMLAAWALGRAFIPGMRVPLVPVARVGASALGTGAAVFLAALPVVMISSFAWQSLLRLAGIPVVEQDLVEIFTNASSPAIVAVLLFLAICGAPIAEELVFRAGLFRFARTRLPRWAAFLIPAIVFGIAHANLATFVPLVVLGIIFSMAFERTGDIRVSMIAHGLFNLNTSVVVLLGGAGS